MYGIVAIAVVGLLFIGLKLRAQGKVKFENVTPAVFANYVDSAEVQLLDVRTAGEYAEGHLKGAMMVDVKSSSFLEDAKRLLKTDKPVAVYCRSGKRSAAAATQLTEAGYRVINMEGGILRWQSEGREVVK